jgi:uncharacterized protein YqjF (DUF2071 family)
MAGTFLQAEWRKLAMANYGFDQKLLNKYVPCGTEIDFWKGTCYVSLVGFMFVNTRVMGFAVPFHRHFEEVNLRFYVRRKVDNEWRRGVVFVREIVPKPALTFVANSVYHENYQTMPMCHSWSNRDNELTVEYQWKKTRWNSLRVVAANSAVSIHEGSEEEFITEHYWGYAKVSEAKTTEYGVEHPKWEVYPVKSHSIEVDYSDIYGTEFEALTRASPKSVFLAEGSAIVVKRGRAI